MTPKVPRIFTYEMGQDDPRKCTSAKMRKLGLARRVSRNSILPESIVLNPSSDSYLTRNDRERALGRGIVVIDCSWELAQSIFQSKFRGVQKRLPGLLAGNPTNYSKIGRLSSVEAAAAAVYIFGFEELANRLCSIYKWGVTFLTLNRDLLFDYSRASSEDEIVSLQSEYFPHLDRLLPG